MAKDIIPDYEWTAEVFTEPPDGFHARLTASACFIRFEDKFLLLERCHKKDFGGLWCLPGGKIDPGESHFDCILREVHEEVGITLDPSHVFHLQTYYIRHPRRKKHPPLEFILSLYFAPLKTLPSTLTISPKEHRAYAWKTFDSIDPSSLIPGEHHSFFDLLPLMN